MHASIWKFTGNTFDLLLKYDGMVEEVGHSNFILHMCLATPDGIMLIDTCPNQEAYDTFVSGGFLDLLAQHGLPEPEIVDYPVHEAYASGRSMMAPST